MSIWINQQEKQNQTSLTYNANITYNNMSYSYNGKLATVWSKQIKN